MTTEKPIDFAKVETLRKHMLLTMADMAAILKVSRITYSGWVDGKKIRKSNAERVKAKLRTLLKLMSDHDWPTPEVVAMPQKNRSDRIKELLKEYEPQEESAEN